MYDAISHGLDAQVFKPTHRNIGGGREVEQVEVDPQGICHYRYPSNPDAPGFVQVWEPVGTFNRFYEPIPAQPALISHHTVR